MKYFVTEQERSGTCYHEFYKGAWDGSTFWRADSLLLHDDVLCEHRGFWETIAKVVPAYDTYGETRITHEDWQKIGALIRKRDAGSRALYAEADAWLGDVWRVYDCFTILGI